jgi:hypothetical protein
MNKRFLTENKSVYDIIKDDGRFDISDIKNNSYFDSNPQKASKLIELVLLNMSISVIVSIESKLGQRKFVIGNNEIGYINDFFFEGKKLVGLDVLSEFNGLSFDKLPYINQSTFEDYKVQISIIQPPTDENIIKAFMDYHSK